MPAKVSNDQRLKILQEKYPRLKISYSHNIKYKYYLNFECPICKSDRYSISGRCESLFTSEYEALIKKPPCRCNSKFKTKEMMILDVEEYLLNKGFVIEKIHEWENWHTKIDAKCVKHNEIATSSNTINKLLHGKVNIFCKFCKKNKVNKNIKACNEKQQLVIDTLLKGTSYKGKALGKGEVEVSCSKCAEDMYCMKGLCQNKFKTNINSLRRGNNVSCRCSKRPAYTKEMRQLQIETMMLTDKEGFKFLGWVSDYVGVNDTYFYYSCPRHGKTSSSVNNYINNNRRCIQCRNEDMRWGFYKARSEEKDTLYVLITKADSEESFVKIGRTFRPKRREQDYNCPDVKYELDYHTLVEGTHKDIYELEQDVHRYLKDFHYTPMKPFGGSAKECFKVSIECVEDCITTLIDTGNYSSTNLVNVG